MDLPVNYEETHWSKRREVREEYVRRQKGLCHYCKESLKGKPSKDVLSMKINRLLYPSNFFKYPVHLHHDHNNKMTIGAVHNYCNAVLWEYHGE